MGSTALTTFVPSVRCILGDSGPDFFQFSEDNILKAIRLELDLGKIPGVTTDGTNALTDGDDLSPISLDATIQQNWAKVVLYAARRFVMPNAAAYSFRTRALAEHWGEQKEMVFELLADIYWLEAGTGGE